MRGEILETRKFIQKFQRKGLTWDLTCAILNLQ